MQQLRHWKEEMVSAIRNIPDRDLEELERLLQNLTPGQIEHVCATMERMFMEDRVSLSEYRFLDYLFEKWRSHSLATKLALVAFIRTLSDTGSWPDDAAPTLSDVCL